MLDRSVTVRYFRLTSRLPAFTFQTGVDAAMALGASPHQREKVISAGVTLRLEGARAERGLLLGEIVRVQTENIPPEARRAGLVPLGIGGLGHSVAFAYDNMSKVIAIQFDPRGVSLGRLLDYIHVVLPNCSLDYDTIVSEDAWERYNQGQPKTVTLKIASPQSLDAIDGPAGSVLDVSKQLAQISDAPFVTVEMSMGRGRRSHLSKRLVDSVIRRFTQGVRADSVESLVVKSKREGMPTDTIDFVNDFARDQEILELDSDDPAQNIARRLAYVSACMRSRLDSLREIYAAQ